MSSQSDSPRLLTFFWSNRRTRRVFLFSRLRLPETAPDESQINRLLFPEFSYLQPENPAETLPAVSEESGAAVEAPSTVAPSTVSSPVPGNHRLAPFQFTEAIIFNHISHEKRISKKRFRQFDVIKAEPDLKGDNCCAICFDKFEFEAKRALDDPQELCVKRRKLSQDRSPIISNLLNPQELPQPQLQPDEEEEDNDDAITIPDNHNATRLPCGHEFGNNCLFQWLKNSDTCPYCRDKITDPYKSSRQLFIVKRLQSSAGIRELLMELAR